MSESTVMYRCPTCGGNLSYDPASSRYRCESCGQLFEESDLHTAQQAAPDEAQQAGGACVYSCPSCGAKITAGETTGALRCYFCRSPLVLEGKFTSEMKPDGVLPFEIDRRDARERFLKWLRKKRYLPREFYAPGAIDDLSGIYYPYWLADYTLDAEFHGEGQIVTHSSTPNEEITTTQIFEVMRRGKILYRDLARSALQKSNRQLSDAVFPYPVERMQGFKTCYLTGFQAERRDIDRAQVSPDIEDEIRGYADNAFSNHSRYTTLSGRTESSVEDASYRYVLLPAWVFTYLGAGKRLYHFIMNGATGEVCGKLPLNGGKVLLHGALCGAAMFALLCLGGWLLW